MDYDLQPRAHALSHTLNQASFDHDQTLSDIEAPGFVSNVATIRSSDGGALRTFSGGLAHENGWYPSAKAGRLLHYEGIAQLEFVIRSEVDFNVARLATESVRFEFPSSRGRISYTADVELVAPDGSIKLVELKRNALDLKNPEYQEKLAAVAQICREQGIEFEVVLKSDIWLNRTHKRNAELCASRRFCSISVDHRLRLAEHAEETGRKTTFGALSKHLEPRCGRSGDAVVLALAARRGLRIDLSQPLLDSAPVTIV